MQQIHRGDTRGKSDLGWLHSRFSFSFAHYWNPERMGFGALRVINDDIIEPSSGFGLHHHEHMEIITIMLSGTLTHTDSMGNKGEITAGEVQVMSAGKGVNHSEWNRDATEQARLFQIWILTDARTHVPRYDQKRFDSKLWKNKFHTLVSGKKEKDALFIHQDATITRTTIGVNKEVIYKLRSKDHGLYCLVIEGNVHIGGQLLGERDAVAISDESEVRIQAESNADILAIEIPLL